MDGWMYGVVRKSKIRGHYLRWGGKVSPAGSQKYGPYQLLYGVGVTMRHTEGKAIY